MDEKIENNNLENPLNQIKKEERLIDDTKAEAHLIRNDEKTIKERKEKIFLFLKQKKDWIIYLFLAFIISISVYIRTRNISKLKDVTTGDWILGPDLDPFLFLRWTQYIAEHGSLMANDAMRYVPLGYNTAGEMKLLSYMIVWLYNFLHFFSSEVTVTYAAIVFPVFMAALTAVAFFLFARKIFHKEKRLVRNLIALIATSFFIMIPSLLPRTIAGIPEKESAAFFFMFMAFYFFLEAFTAKNFKKGIIFSILAGIFTAGMALIWGAYIFIFFTIPPAIFICFLLGKIGWKEFYIYATWLISSFIFMVPFSTRYNLGILIRSTSTGVAGIGVLLIIGLSLILMKNDLFNKIRRKTKLSKQLFSSLLLILVLIIIVSLFFGPKFIPTQLSSLKSNLIVPQTTRFGLTVAENKQPYFLNDWKNSFGPIIFNLPAFFWLTILGSVALFAHLIKKLTKKEKLILVFSYFIFLICLIFSRYSPDHILNGVSGMSLLVYFGGILFFFGSVSYFYYKRYKKGNFFVFKEFNFSYIMYFIILTLGIIGARGGIRLIMVLGAVSPVAVGFLIVKLPEKYFKEKEDLMKFILLILSLVVIIVSVMTLNSYYQANKSVAENYAPGAYQQQWQKAMSWVRENTSENAVFAHWWDYGYWVQSMGERATILDGGNTYVYWNHLMGRHVLTGTDEKTSLEFLYAHDGTHLLIDSSEIGKYTAYSSIGSDENYDRFSWIQSFLLDEGKTYETSEETSYLYSGGFLLDDDLVWEEDGKKIFFPKKSAGVGAIIIRKNDRGMLQPQGVFVYNGQQYRIPLRYLFFEGKLHDFKTGLESGAFLYPRVEANGIDKIGAAFYLSEKTVHSQLAKLYLYGEETDYFKLVHTEENFIIESLKQQGAEVGDFVYYGGFQGPIKIWEVSYPQDIELKEEFLETEFPNEELYLAKLGEY
jgi:asparagine N-glycosylation enzyme membrane subunit Stt3